MLDLTTLEIPDERELVDAWLAPLAVACMSAADEYRLFDAFGDQPLAIDSLARTLELDEAALLDVCRVLVAMDLLQVNGDAFVLSAKANAYCVSTSPLYRGAALLLHRTSPLHSRVIKTLKEGWDPLLGGGEAMTKMWEAGQLTPLAAVPFTHWMHATSFAATIMAARSDAFDGISSILDVGGGSGAFSIAFAAHHPEKTVALMDLPPVCLEAEKFISQYGFSDKIQLSPGSFFDDDWYPSEAVYLCNILHDWEKSQCQQILEHAFQALPTGGSIYIHETVLDDNKITPKSVALLNLFMRINHKGQMFSCDEIASQLSHVGFKTPEVVHTFGYYALIKATKQ